MPQHRKITHVPVHNRIMAILDHIPPFAFQGETRLARESGISKAALSRVVTGKSSPSFALVSTVTRTISKHIGKRVDPHEIISMDGAYPTPSVCDLVGCRGCLPDFAYNREDAIKRKYADLLPGEWSGDIPPVIPEVVREEGR